MTTPKTRYFDYDYMISSGGYSIGHHSSFAITAEGVHAFSGPPGHWDRFTANQKTIDAFEKAAIHMREVGNVDTLNFNDAFRCLKQVEAQALAFEAALQANKVKDGEFYLTFDVSVHPLSESYLRAAVTGMAEQDPNIYVEAGNLPDLLRKIKEAVKSELNMEWDEEFTIYDWDYNFTLMTLVEEQLWSAEE